MFVLDPTSLLFENKTKIRSTYSRSESELKMDRLELAARKVGGELELSANVVRLLSDKPTSLNLHRHTQNVLSAVVDHISDLSRVQEFVRWEP